MAPYKGLEGRDLPPLLAELLRALRPERHRLRGAAARASRPRRRHTIDLIQEMKRQGVKIILVEPYFDLKTPQSVARETGAKVVVLPPSVGGDKEVTDYIKLFDYDLELLVAAIKATGAQVMDLDRPAVPGRALRGQPDPDRHPRLPRRARGGARRDLRGPLPRPDRRPGRHHRASCCRSRATTPTGPGSTGSACSSPSSGPPSSRRSRRATRASRRRRSSASPTRWPPRPPSWP